MITRKRTRTAVAAGAVATTLTLLAQSGAMAVDPPDWKAGYTPTGDGCIPMVPLAFPTPEFTAFLDVQRPAFTSATPNVVRLGNAPQAASLWKLRVQQTCSGTAGLLAVVDRGDGTSHVWDIDNLPADGNYFDTTYDLRTDRSADEPGMKLDHGDLGAYGLNTATAFSRFGYLVLDQKRTELLHSDPPGEFPFAVAGITGAGRGQAYVLRDTTAAASTAGKKKVKQGKKVTVSTSFRVANGSSYVGLAGQTVRLERRAEGSTTWVSVKTARTASSGAVSFTDKPKKTSTYRVVNAGTFAAPWTAPSTSAQVTVKVKAKKADAKKGKKKAGKKGKKKSG